MVVTRCISSLLIALGLLVSGGGVARADVSAGVAGVRWQMPDDVANGAALDVRGRLGSVGVQVGAVRMKDLGAPPSAGYATPPDLRAEVVLSPFRNDYVSPYLTLGAGVATYADNRLSLLGGGGVEIGVGEHVAIDVAGRIVAPDPRDVARTMEQRAMQQLESEVPTSLPQLPSLSDYVDDYYNLDTYELTVGVRVRY